MIICASIAYTIFIGLFVLLILGEWLLSDMKQKGGEYNNGSKH